MTTTGQDRDDALHALRGIAALMVVHSHLIYGVVESLRLPWWPHEVIRDYIIIPLGLRQDFGPLGVMIFFIISGYVITHVSGRDGRAGFLIKRLFRIYPPLIVTIAAAVLVYHLQAWTTGRADYFSPVPLGDVALGMLAIDRLMEVARPILPAGWTLTIEVLFYAHAALLLPLLAKRPILFALLLCAWSIALCALARAVPGIAWVGSNFQMFPLFAVGIAFHALDRIGPRTGLIVLALACYGVNIWLGGIGDFARLSSYLLQTIYATIVFALVMLWPRGVRVPRVFIFLGTISYSVYLIHHPFGLFAYGWVFGWFGLTASIVAAYAVSLLLSWASYAWIEAPAQALARRLTARLSR